MKILLLRHGPAGERAEFAKSGRPDAERPLTAKGRAKTRRAAWGLARLERPGIVATSPLLRARQTAEILRKACAVPEPLFWKELAPGAPHEALLQRLKSMPSSASLALVGHEPRLSAFAAYLVGSRPAALPLKKAGACLIEFTGAPHRGGGTLAWSLPPKVLRALR